MDCENYSSWTYFFCQCQTLFIDHFDVASDCVDQKLESVQHFVNVDNGTDVSRIRLAFCRRDPDRFPPVSGSDHFKGFKCRLLKSVSNSSKVEPSLPH